MPKLYDLFWHSEMTGGACTVASNLFGGTVAAVEDVPAVILFPSFFTPGIFIDGDEKICKDHFELLLASPKGTTITPKLVNERLAITDGLARHRGLPPMPLFNDPFGKIVVDPAPPDPDGRIATHSQFEGILHNVWNRHLSAAYKNEGVFWRVRVHKDAFEQTVPNTRASSSVSLRTGRDLAIEKLFGEHRDPFKSPIAFAVEEGGRVRPDVPDAETPILAHHPIARYPAGKKVLGKVLHITDLHLNMRQDLLAASNVTVTGDYCALDVSPHVGDLVHNYASSVHNILAQKSAEVDAIFVGGDLVDHIRNAVVHTQNAAKFSRPLPRTAFMDVWDAVALDDSYSEKYVASPDFVAAFSLLRHHVEKTGVPMFGVSGNHDAYVDGYGISPRITNWQGYRWLANEGIPADHNLTMYEAILIFGKTYDRHGGYGQVRKFWETNEAGSSNFWKESFDWFHTVFTPFSDARLQLPNQQLLLLGWGESEMMLRNSDSGKQGSFGQLPRANSVFKPGPKAMLLDSLAADAMPTLLVSHFTFASFGESIPERTETSPPTSGDLSATLGPSGSIALDMDPKNPAETHHGIAEEVKPWWTKHEFGTFELNRSEVYMALLEDPAKVSAVLTGHSHRKGLYFLHANTKGSCEATMVGLRGGSVERDKILSHHKHGVPVVLSDSAGPLPRRNVSGELASWGSDRAAGSLLSFDESARLLRVEVVQGAGETAKPRLAVAMEYFHLQVAPIWLLNSALATPVMVSKAFRSSRYGNQDNTAWRTFHVPIRKRWEDLGLHVRDLCLLGRGLKAPIKLDSPSPETHDEFVIPEFSWRKFPLWIVPGQSDDFKTWLDIKTSSERFLALRFAHSTEPGSLWNHYNTESWWVFEVSVKHSRPDVQHKDDLDISSWEVRPLQRGFFSGDTSSDRPVVEQPDFRYRIEQAKKP